MNADRKKGKSWIVLLAAALAVGAICFRCHFGGRPLSVAGYSFFIVSTASMEPEYAVSTLVVIKNVPIEKLEVGDTVVFKSDALKGGLAFHRIVKFVEGGFYTKGDNNNHEDNQLINKDTYIGRSVCQSYPLGVYIFAIQNPAGFILFFAAPFLAVSLCFYTIKRALRKRPRLEE